MKHTLHKTKTGFIVTNDVTPTFDNDILVNGKTYNNAICKYRPSPCPPPYVSNLDISKKLIAQEPQLNFSDLKEDDCKKVGWYDIESFAKKSRTFINNLAYCCKGDTEEHIFDVGFNEGFQKCQELMSDRFTEKDMMDIAGYMAAADNKRPIHELKEEAIEYIKRKSNKSWEIEGHWENDKFKVTKVL
jgi:hypothetical protein